MTAAEQLAAARALVPFAHLVSPVCRKSAPLYNARHPLSASHRAQLTVVQPRQQQLCGERPRQRKKSKGNL